MSAAPAGPAGSAPGAYGGGTEALDERISRWVPPILRVVLAIVWFQGASWKKPPEFAGLQFFTKFGVSEPVLAPWAWLLENIILPNLSLFGWGVLFVEAGLAVFLLLGLATRFWALVGMGQTLAIALSALNAPHEWVWSYLLMFLMHLAIFATAAGRTGGLDGIFRPMWLRSRSLLGRALALAS